MRFQAALVERLGKFGLEVEPTKTKVLEFGRDAEGHARARGGKPETFDFLGFTHYCSRTRDGKRYRMKRVTARKKFRAKLVAFKEWLKVSRVMPTQWIMQEVGLKLRGHYAYYGVTDNYRGDGAILPRGNEDVIQVAESAEPPQELQGGRNSRSCFRSSRCQNRECEYNSTIERERLSEEPCALIAHARF